MYIIYNSDGSIEKKSITEYIQQGNSYANVLFVTVKDTDLGDYTASAIVTLPNGQNVGAIVEEAEEPVEIDGVEYNGYYITLDETCTLMAGAIRISLSLTIDETRMVTYPIYLNVNATPYDADAPVMISYNQYVELLAAIAEVTTPNNPTITLQKNGVTVGYFNLNQASNKTINYVLNKSDVGLGNVDNTSDATKKSNFTGSIASGNTGFVTGGDIYNYALLKNVDQDVNSSKRFINDKQLKFLCTGYSNPVTWYAVGNESGELCFSKYHYDVGTGTNVRDYLIQWDGENFKPSSSNTHNLGTNDNRWKTVYLKELNFSATLGALGTQTYSFKISGGGDLQLNTTLFQISSGGNLQVPHLTIRRGNTIYGIGIGDDDILSIAQFHFNKESGHEAFYHEIGSYYDTVWGPADLGTSTYPWKDLYLSGNANIGGKINDLTLPNGTHTLATLDDIERDFVLTTTDDIATVKALLQSAPPYTCYLSNGSGLTDISSAVLNGDYDNVTVGNPTFASTNQWIKTNQSTTSHIFIVFAKNSNVIYFVIGANLKALVKGTLFVTDDGYPSRFHSNRDYCWYKI